MTEPLPMCLVFRLGGIGFAVPVGMVEELLADADVQQYRDTGRLDYRGVSIGHFDLAGRLGLPSAKVPSVGPLLVLKGRDKPRAVLVEKVEGVFPGSQFQRHAVPPLLSLQGPLPYRHLLLWREEPLVYCDPEFPAELAEEA